MAGQSLRPSSPETQQEENSWILYFSFSSWLILSLFFLTGVYKNIILSADKHYKSSEDHQKIMRVLIDQEIVNKTPSADKKYFIGDKNNEASGKITELKGFESMSQTNEMRFSKAGGTKSHSGKSESEENAVENALGNRFIAKILHDMNEQRRSVYDTKVNQIPGDSAKATIPGNYEFKKQFVFSWDNNGMPVIPTMYEKHYKYFKHILDDIQNNWAPPGGIPYPTFDTAFNSQAYIPGRNSYQTFPDQDIQVVFSIGSNGDLLETKLWKSRGFKSLDRSCLDAIIRSKNFGPPPEDLLDNNHVFIMPLTFRIIGNE